MRALPIALFILVLALASGLAAAGSFEVRAPRVSVVFDDQGLEDYARRVAHTAEEALSQLEFLFGTVPGRVVIELDGRTDLFTAIAPPLPRPRVSLPVLFPALPEIDLRSSDPLLELLLHELTHSVQLSYLERPEGILPLPRLGLVGEAVAPLPPGWLLEGLAVWVAGTRTPRAAFPDARTRGVLHALAVEGEWPTLEEVSLLSFDSWPAGEARYLLGGVFVAHLVERHGWETLLAALREANAGWYLLPFSEAWFRAAGTSLEAEWREWSQEVLEEATARLAEQRDERSSPLLEGGRASPVLALSEGGSLAWRPAAGGLAVAELGEEGISGARLLLPPSRTVLSLDWLDETRLLYSRLAPGLDDRFADLFVLDLESGEETRLTQGARPRFARVEPGGCLLYVRGVVGEQSRLRRLCPGKGNVDVFAVQEGSHIVGLAVSPSGRLALSIWRAGYVDLALLESGELHWLTQDAAQDLDPAWTGDDELVFRSDRSGVHELYALSLSKGDLVRLEPSLGGAFAPSARGGRLVFARMGGRGYDLALLRLEDVQPSAAVDSRFVSDGVPAGPQLGGQTDDTGSLEVKRFDPLPSLVPYGWLPSLGRGVNGKALAAGVTVFGEDDSGEHSYRLSVGLDPGLSGPLGGGWGNLSYHYRVPDQFDLFQRPPPLGFGVTVGAWPHVSHLERTREVASGVSAFVSGRIPLAGGLGLARLGGGAVSLGSAPGLQPEGRLDLAWTRRYTDIWGYVIRGGRVSSHLLWSASADGGDGAGWLEGSLALPGPPVVELTLRGGLRPPPAAPVRLEQWSLLGRIAVRDSFPLAWRLADGVLALERLTLEGGATAWFDGSAGVAAQLSLWGDAMVRYGAPVSPGVTVGLADGFWYRVGVRLPF